MLGIEIMFWVDAFCVRGPLKSFAPSGRAVGVGGQPLAPNGDSGLGYYR